MGKPALTEDTDLVIGDDTWVIDLGEHSNGFTVTDTAVGTPGAPATRRYWIDKNLTEQSRSLNVPVLYYGDATDALSQREEGTLIAVIAFPDGTRRWVGGAAGWRGLPSTAPVNDVLVNNVNFLSRERWLSGSVAVPFKFSNGNVEMNLPTFTNTAVGYIALTVKDPSGSRTVTIDDGSTIQLLCRSLALASSLWT